MPRLGGNSLTHGHTRNGKRSPEYRAWDNMKFRCLNSNCKAYHNYGGRGISICSEWINSFEAFLSDMGERPEGLSLDRIDNNGNYEPGNCRWATSSEQMRNQRKSING